MFIIYLLSFILLFSLPERRLTQKTREGFGENENDIPKVDNVFATYMIDGSILGFIPCRADTHDPVGWWTVMSVF